MRTESGNVYRLLAVVQGRVQGVGYRYWAHHTAKRYDNIAGYVRNLPDGTVEVEAECPQRAPLEALLTELHVGPHTAEVEGVKAEWHENVPPHYTSFRVD